ncbi:MAG: glycosyltransferase [Planctomycetes bacterium]|nr:glycosyltransferase [Planctomycetota bacterium]
MTLEVAERAAQPATKAATGILWVARMLYATNIRLRELEFAKRLCARTPIFLLDRHEAVSSQEQSFAAKLRLRMRLRTGGFGVIERGPITRFRMPVTAATGPVLNRVAARRNEGRILAAMREFGCDRVFHSNQFFFLPPEQRSYRYHFDLVDNFFGEWPDTMVGASRKAFLRDFMRRADTLSTMSHTMCDKVEAFTGRRPMYLPNSADVAGIAAWPRARAGLLRDKMGLNERRVVGFIGNHTMHFDGMEMLIDAWLPAHKANPRLALMIVGPGSAKLTKPRGLGVEQGIHVIGPVPATEVWDYFLASDLGVHTYQPNPITNDATPLNVVEFGASGKPMLGVNLTELSRINLPHVKLLPYDAAAWTRAFLDEESFAPPDQAKLGDAMQTFSWEENSKKLATAMEL